MMNFLIYAEKEVMPFNNNFANVGVEKRSKEKSARIQEENSFSISINETWLPMVDGHIVIKNDEMPDLRTFWKGEGNKKSIREAQGICINLATISFFYPFILS